MNVKSVISRCYLLKTNKICDSLGHVHPAQQSPSAPQILASSCLNIQTNHLITIIVKPKCWFDNINISGFGHEIVRHFQQGLSNLCENEGPESKDSNPHLGIHANS